MENETLGWVIEKDLTGELFAGYLHPGTKKVGHPVWVRNLNNKNFDGGKASIHEEAKEAADIARSLFLREGINCTARPVGILR